MTNFGCHGRIPRAVRTGEAPVLYLHHVWAHYPGHWDPPNNKFFSFSCSCPALLKHSLTKDRIALIQALMTYTLQALRSLKHVKCTWNHQCAGNSQLCFSIISWRPRQPEEPMGDDRCQDEGQFSDSINQTSTCLNTSWLSRLVLHDPACKPLSFVTAKMMLTLKISWHTDYFQPRSSFVSKLCETSQVDLFLWIP